MSPRFTSVLPMTIWFWLTLFMCMTLTASFSCYNCGGYRGGPQRDECKDGDVGSTVDCEQVYNGGGFNRLPPDEKYACSTKSKNNKIEDKGCKRVPEAFTGECAMGEYFDYSRNYTKFKGSECYCYTDLCNNEEEAKKAKKVVKVGSGTSATVWNNLQWSRTGGLACLSIYIIKYLTLT